MSLFFRVSGIVLVLLVFLCSGMLIGTRHAIASSRVESLRFAPTDKPGFAFDTKLGLECNMDGVDMKLPAGFTLDIPRCATLAQR